jgi:hypothetical protein
MRRAVISLTPKVPKDHSSFAKLIALRLESHFAIERQDKENLVIQWFHEQKRVWVKGGGARKLHEKAEDVLHALFCNLPPEKRAIFRNKGFISPVVDLLKNYLEQVGGEAMPQLDSEGARNKLRFPCGNLLDFKTGRVRPCVPQDRISFCTGYPYNDWESALETKSFITQLCTDLNKLWSKDADWEELDDATERMERAVAESSLYRIIYQLFEDHSMALWMLRQLTRAVSGCSGFEELLFMVDPRGTNGKGTMLALLKAVLGTGTDGYYMTSLDYAKHFVANGASKLNVNNPEIANIAGKRLVPVNETPAEDDSRASSCFNATLAKALASGDEPMSATAKYKDPSSFYPQCLLMFCTNSHPIFPAKDGGLKSRISYVAMPFEWVQEVTQAGQRQIDVSIKETVVKMLQPEFLFWARLLAQGLVPKGRLISPRPESVRSDTENQFFADAIRAAPEAALSASEVGNLFVREYLVNYQESWYRGGGYTIATRDQINKVFLEFAADKKYRTRPHEAFRGILEGAHGNDSRKSEGGKKVRVYWRPESYNGVVDQKCYVTL